MFSQISTINVKFSRRSGYYVRACVSACLCACVRVCVLARARACLRACVRVGACFWQLCFSSVPVMLPLATSRVSACACDISVVWLIIPPAVYVITRATASEIGLTIISKHCTMTMIILCCFNVVFLWFSVVFLFLLIVNFGQFVRFVCIKKPSFTSIEEVYVISGLETVSRLQEACVMNGPDVSRAHRRSIRPH